MENKSEKNTPWWQPGMFLFFRLSGWIGGPVIIAVFVGKWLDRKYNKEPWLFLISVGVAFVFSMFGIVYDTTRAMKEIEKDAIKSKAQNSKSQINSK
jgi:F0F1-type ATP synthase assembly protein I